MVSSGDHSRGAKVKYDHIKHEVLAPLSAEEMALFNGGSSHFPVKNFATEIWTKADRAQYAQMSSEQQVAMSERMAEAKNIRNCIQMRQVLDKVMEGKGGLETSRYATPKRDVKAASQQNNTAKKVNGNIRATSNDVTQVKTEKSSAIETQPPQKPCTLPKMSRRPSPIKTEDVVSTPKGHKSQSSTSSNLSPVDSIFVPSRLKATLEQASQQADKPIGSKVQPAITGKADKRAAFFASWGNFADKPTTSQASVKSAVNDDEAQPAETSYRVPVQAPFEAAQSNSQTKPVAASTQESNREPSKVSPSIAKAKPTPSNTHGKPMANLSRNSTSSTHSGRGKNDADKSPAATLSSKPVQPAPKTTPSSNNQGKSMAGLSHKSTSSTSSGRGRSKAHKAPNPKQRSPRPSVSPAEAAKWKVNDKIPLADKQWSDDQKQLQQEFFKKSYGGPKRSPQQTRATATEKGPEIPQEPSKASTLPATNGHETYREPSDPAALPAVKAESAKEAETVPEVEATILPAPTEAPSFLDSLTKRLSDLNRPVFIMENGQMYDLPTDTRTPPWQHQRSYDFGFHEYLPTQGRIVYPDAYNQFFEDVPGRVQGDSATTIEKLKQAIDSLKTPSIGSTRPSSEDGVIADEAKKESHNESIDKKNIEQITATNQTQMDKPEDRKGPQTVGTKVHTEGYQIAYDSTKNRRFIPQHLRTLHGIKGSPRATNSNAVKRGSRLSTSSKSQDDPPKKKKLWTVKLKWSSDGGISEVQEIDDSKDEKDAKSPKSKEHSRDIQVNEAKLKGAELAEPVEHCGDSQIFEPESMDAKPAEPIEQPGDERVNEVKSKDANSAEPIEHSGDNQFDENKSEHLPPTDQGGAHLKVSTSETAPKRTLGTSSSEVSDDAVRDEFPEMVANMIAEKKTAESASSSVEVSVDDDLAYTTPAQQSAPQALNTTTSNDDAMPASSPSLKLDSPPAAIETSAHDNPPNVVSAAIDQNTLPNSPMATDKKPDGEHSSERETDPNNPSEISTNYGTEMLGKVEEPQGSPRVKISSVFSTDDEGIEISDEAHKAQQQDKVDQEDLGIVIAADPGKKMNNKGAPEFSPSYDPPKIFHPTKPGCERTGMFSKVTPLDLEPAYLQHVPFPTFAGDKVQDKGKKKIEHGAAAQVNDEMKFEQKSSTQATKEKAQDKVINKRKQEPKVRSEPTVILPEGFELESRNRMRASPAEDDYLPAHLRGGQFPRLTFISTLEKKKPKLEQQLTHAPIPLPPGISMKAKNKSGPIPANNGVKLNKAGKKVSGMKNCRRGDDGIWELPDDPNEIWRQSINAQPEIRMVKMDKPEKLELQLTKWDDLPGPSELNLDPSGWGSVISVHTSEAGLPEKKQHGYGRTQPKMALWEWLDEKEIRDPAGGQVKKVWKFADFNWNREVLDGEVDTTSRGCTLFLPSDFTVMHFNRWIAALVELMLKHPFKIDIYHPAFRSGEKPTSAVHYLDLQVGFPLDTLHGPADPPNFDSIDWDPSDSEQESERLKDPYAKLPTPSVQNDRSKQTAQTIIDARMARAYANLQALKDNRAATRLAREYEYTHEALIPRPDPFGPAQTHDNPFCPRVNIYVRPGHEYDADQCAQIEAYWSRYSLSSPRDGPVLPSHYREIIQATEAKKLPFIVACAPSNRIPNRRRKVVGRKDVHQDRVVGFAYAKPFRSPIETTFIQTVEVVLFVDKAVLRHGVGKTLLDRILPALDPGYQSHVGTEFRCHMAEQLDFHRGGRTTIRKMVISVFYERYDKLNWKGVPLETAEKEQDESLKSLVWKKRMLEEGGFGFVQQADFLNIGAKWVEGLGKNPGSGKAVCMAQFVRETRERVETVRQEKGREDKEKEGVGESRWYRGQPGERRGIVNLV